jgi:O-antigen ligase
MIVPFILLGIFAKFFGRFSTCQVYYGMEICLIPLSFFVLSHKKKYIIYVGLCAVPALVLTKRTPLLGIAVGCIIFLFLIYKFKAVLPTFITIVLGIILVFSIPQFKEKLFYNGSVTLEDVLRGQSDVEDQFNTNGRDVFWPYLLATFYHNNKLIGVGSGTVKGFVQSVNNDYAANFQLVHNDWLTILCENGLIGVIIMGIFFLQVLISCIKYSSKKYPLELRVIAASCAGSLFCTGIHMYFENCVNSFIFTIFFIFYAVFIRAKQNYEKGKLNK